MRLKRLLFLLPLLVGCVFPAAAQTVAVPTSRDAMRFSFAPIVKRVAPAVVNVFSRRLIQAAASPFASDPFFRRFFGEGSPFGLPQQRIQNSLGSGVILDPDGLIVTNHHVIEQAEEITVVLADRREFPAHVLRSDERTDLAVLKIDVPGEKLPVLEVGDSDGLQVGDLVLAVGDPFGVGQTVTSGIVSGLARTAVGISDFRSFIQTDAAINPGNSGGALVDVDGKLVGINTAIFSRSGGSIGIGFAIPTSMVRIVLEGARTGGPIVRAWLGVDDQTVTAEIAQAAGLDHPRGVLVKEVAPRGPAAAAGVHVGDVILSIAGHEVDDPEDLRFRIATLSVDSTTTLRLWHANSERAVTVKVIAPPDDPPREQQTISGRNPLSGATVANLNPALADELGLETSQHGVIVIDIKSGSTAERLGVAKGDVVIAVNRRTIGTVADLHQAVAGNSDSWTLSIRRGDRVLSVTVRG